MAKQELILVGAKTYTVMSFRSDPIKQGEKIDVDPEMAERLRGITVVDAAGGVRKVFVDPNHPRATRLANNMAADAAHAKATTPKPPTTRRRRAKSDA